jgi:hypothetical protein
MGAPGFVVAIQYWAGDEARALRLARLLTAVEPVARKDMVTVALCRRYDMRDPSPEAVLTWKTLGTRFGAMMIRSEREGTGHPAGANALWAGTFEKLAGLWSNGQIQASSVMFVEADGCPVSHDWLDWIRSEHEALVVAGKRILGPRMSKPPHVNGTLVSHLSVWADRPSLHRTPDDQAGDIFHRATLMQEAAASFSIQNAYGAEKWSDEALVGVGRQSAWLASTKDESAIAWAERTLPGDAWRAREEGPR